MIKQGTHCRAPVPKGHIQEVEVETQAAKEEYGNIAEACGDGVRKAKAKLDLKLTRDINGNKMLFIRKRIHKEKYDAAPESDRCFSDSRHR